MKAILVSILRFLNSLKRPSKATNARRIKQNGEDVGSFVIREAIASDIPELAALHVKTWSLTYPNVKKPPTFSIREWQWREQFKKQDGSWFCYVMENSKKELIGFAKGVRRDEKDDSEYKGELNKIYLLFEYHHLRLGRRLLCYVVRRFQAMGINSMLLFAEATNPTAGFYKAMGGKRLGGPTCGNYGWTDLRELAAGCPAD